MTDSAVLLDQALELSPDARKELAMRIWLSAEEGPNRPLSKQEFEAMLLERIQEIENGDVETVDAFEALEQARQRVAKGS